MENRNTRFPEDLVNVRVQANTSYQIKRVIELVQSEKGLELMSCSKIMPNSGSGPRLRQFATFKDFPLFDFDAVGVASLAEFNKLLDY